jgi:hypothetical protein
MSRECYHRDQSRGTAITHFSHVRRAGATLSPAFFCLLSAVCSGQDVVCSAGFGTFDAKSTTGVTLSVGAVKDEGFARRVCEAKLTWDKNDLLVEGRAWQVDVDLMGADLGFGAPVAALQIRKADVDPLMTYEIYSLSKPPRKLRSITGGDSYSAADTNLDGQIEIWTSDAAAVNGFEGIPLSALDFAPAIALRFDHHRLLDVSAEFPSHYDRQIAAVRAQLDAEQLSAFRSSNGTLSSKSPVPMSELRSLRSTEIKVLEIVWSYLYSGREQEAWQALTDMWPSADYDRIRAAIVKARGRGIGKEVDGVSSATTASSRKKKVMIYDRLTETAGVDGGPVSVVNETGGPDDKMKAFQADTQPRPIFFRRPPPPAGAPADALTTEVVVNMVIDSAGKVWSIKTEGKPDKDIIEASAEWKFVPALKGGRPVASRLRLGVTPSQ